MKRVDEFNFPFKHEFDWGYSNMYEWLEREKVILDELEQYSSNGNFSLNEKYGTWYFELEEDFLIFLMKYEQRKL